MWRAITLIILTGVFLSACTTAPKGPEHAVNLTSQLEKVAEIRHWQMRGKIAFRQGNEAASLNLVWKNDSGDFDFRLSNFLGVSMVDLNVTSKQSSLTADGETYYDADPELLIHKTTGIVIPVAPLLSWVKGLPLKDDTFTLTDKGLVNTLESGCTGCSNWSVKYGQYGKVYTDEASKGVDKGNEENGAWLPHSITLTQAETPLAPQTQLKIKIYEWLIL
ncbi:MULTISPECIES: lipoprotein insertase outer membrane protein LolB [unclassified Alteromonas]|uniref:lipoprotein insertase outer membrane protein LolB n=1 Tax=unclassified Alteromonas TaxID=2614992 RepID=UPI000509B2FE|nr:MULTISPECIES: lipoprotein insertase outer membrane protein LolB [unclassified Alteromonas]